MKGNKIILFLIRIVLLFMFIPIVLFSLSFGEYFSRALRKALDKEGLNEVQRFLNWKGIPGVFELARTPK